MHFMSAAYRILQEALPIILMIALIPFVRNDYYLAALFIAITAVAFLVEYRRKDLMLFLIGSLIFSLGEALFITTDIETFKRTSLFGIMPIWLPILWGYIFVALRRAVVVLDSAL